MWSMDEDNMKNIHDKLLNFHFLDMLIGDIVYNSS